MSDPKQMPERIWANRDHYENGWHCDDTRLDDGTIDPDGETKYMGGDGVEYIRADLAPAQATGRVRCCCEPAVHTPHGCPSPVLILPIPADLAPAIDVDAIMQEAEALALDINCLYQCEFSPDRGITLDDLRCILTEAKGASDE